MKTPIKYILRHYQKRGDKPIGEEEIKNFILEEARAALELPKDEPLVEVYRITPHSVDYFQSKVESRIYLDQYDYFLECVGPPLTEFRS